MTETKTTNPVATRDVLTVDDLHASAERNKQWGRWAPDDEIGTLNNVTPAMDAAASHLIRKGKAFGLTMPFDSNGPHKSGPHSRRFDPIHVMLRAGVDCCAPNFKPMGLYGSDDMVTMPLGAAPHERAIAVSAGQGSGRPSVPLRRIRRGSAARRNRHNRRVGADALSQARDGAVKCVRVSRSPSVVVGDVVVRRDGVTAIGAPRAATGDAARRDRSRSTRVAARDPAPRRRGQALRSRCHPAVRPGALGGDADIPQMLTRLAPWTFFRPGPDGKLLRAILYWRNNGPRQGRHAVAPKPS